MSSPHAEERIWLVDIDDNPIDAGWQLRDNVKNWQNFRVVNAFVKNPKGQIWFPRRGPNKRIFPNCLDMSMGGHLDWPETYEQAFEHELREELNLDADKVSKQLLGYLTPRHYPKLSACMKVWEISMDQAPNFNPNDFSGSEWLTPTEFRERVKNGEQTKGDLPVLVDIFYP